MNLLLVVFALLISPHAKFSRISSRFPSGLLCCFKSMLIFGIKLNLTYTLDLLYLNKKSNKRKQLMKRRKWKRASACGLSAWCLEVAHDNGKVFLRDSKKPRKIISVDLASWQAFRKAVKIGEFNR